MSMRGADAVVCTLAAAGVDTIFCLSGNHIMPLFDAVIDRPISLIHARDERAAVHMADAYARMTGKVGVAMVTGGPGHANALGALYTALAGETPLLLLSGHAPLAEVGSGSFQELDQAAMAAPSTKASWTVRSAVTAAEDVAKALRLARSGRPGPVHVSLPVDALEQRVGDIILPSDFTPGVQNLAANDVARIVGYLRQANRPLIIVPPALCMTSGRSALAALSRLGVPVVPMESPRGIRDPVLGDVGPLLREADCLLLLGKQLDFTLAFGDAATPECRWIVVDPDETMLRRARKLLRGAAHLVQADSVAAIEALVTVGPVSVDSNWRQLATQRLARRCYRDSTTLDSAALCTALGSFVEKLDRPIFVSDGGEIGQWAQALVSAPDRLINGIGGAIGPAIPFAIGAKLAAPDRPVLAVIGDGTFGFHMAEFETAMRYALPFVAVIGNDGRWNAEYQIQLRRYGRERTVGCQLNTAIRYEKVVEAFGGHGALVDNVRDIEPALRQAFASRRPACVNVLIAGLPAPSLTEVQR